MKLIHIKNVKSGGLYQFTPMAKFGYKRIITFNNLAEIKFIPFDTVFFVCDSMQLISSAVKNKQYLNFIPKDLNINLSYIVIPIIVNKIMLAFIMHSDSSMFQEWNVESLND